MTYDVGLFATGMAVGLLLLLTHAFALALRDRAAEFLKALPRNERLGEAAWAGVVLWALWLVLTRDLGEFASLRGMMAAGTGVLGVMVWMFLKDFLAVRALAAALLLGAEVLLCAAFMQPQKSRLLLVVLAYGWIIAGMFLGAAPWLLRDGIAWLLQKAWRFSAAAWAGALYGTAVLVAALIFWRN